MNDMLHHNNPPDMTATASDTTADISAWMAEHPVITTEADARAAKVFIDRGVLCGRDLEDERSNQVRPLNEKVKEINTHYRPARELLDTVLGVLKERMGSYLYAEEQKRIAIAAEAQRLADEAERAARDAESRERDGIDSAICGEVGVDVAELTGDADARFAEYQKANRQAALAERETKVRVGGGFTRSLSLKTRDVMVVVDYVAAIADIGIGNEIVDEAIIKAARAYKRVFGKYPAGIRVEIERKV